MVFDSLGIYGCDLCWNTERNKKVMYELVSHARLDRQLFPRFGKKDGSIWFGGEQSKALKSA
jgi:hypothetical protein